MVVTPASTSVARKAMGLCASRDPVWTGYWRYGPVASNPLMVPLAARRSSAEHLIATKALRCTATAWMLTVAESLAKN